MVASDLINLSGLTDNAKCFSLVCQHRWPEGARCSMCAAAPSSETAMRMPNFAGSVTGARLIRGASTT